MEGLSSIYEELEREISGHGPLCNRSGECCRFGKYGHRLYASGAEAGYFALKHGGPPAAVEGQETCPYLAGGVCTAREGRPLGCRVYYCDPKYAGVGEGLTEKYLKRIGELSDRLGLEWEYKPFLAHLDDLRGNPAMAGEKEEDSWRS